MKKLIIFDNDEDILSVCRYILEEDGWEVHTFTDGDQLVERVSEILPEAILMDDWIPPKGGVATTQLLKQTVPLRHSGRLFFNRYRDRRAGRQGWCGYLSGQTFRP
jgi:CheY-like chemotaxis protein